MPAQILSLPIEQHIDIFTVFCWTLVQVSVCVQSMPQLLAHISAPLNPLLRCNSLAYSLATSYRSDIINQYKSRLNCLIIGHARASN